MLGCPHDLGPGYEDVTFAAEDGVPLEGWLVPCPGFTRTVVLSHPRGFSRTGIPADEEPWRSEFAATGNDIRVDLLPDIASRTAPDITSWHAICAISA